MNRALPSFDAAEERNKLSHFTVQGFDLEGIVQGGANDGEEYENAIRLGVERYIAFEPLQSAFLQLASIPVPSEYNYLCLPFGLHNKTQIAKLQVTAGDGKGSSIFDTAWEHDEVKKNWNQGQAAIVGKQNIFLTRFDEWAKNSGINLARFDTLQLDTQGNEMEILEGMGEYLNQFKYLCIELSIEPVYYGETPGHKVAEWLDERGFILDSPIYAHNDSFFIRKDIKAASDQTYRGRC